MTTAVSEFTRSSLRYVVHPTSGIEPDALLGKQQPVEPDLWKQRIDELLAIRLMDDDWDGMGATAPDVSLVDSALQLALILKDNNVRPACRVVAGLTGTVLLEWQGQGGGYFEVEVTRPHQADCTLIVPNQQTQTESIQW